MKKLAALLILSIPTFHVNAMLFNPADNSTSGAIVTYKDYNGSKWVVLRELNEKEFPNVTQYGPLFEWEGDDKKEPELDGHTKAILAHLSFEKASQYQSAYACRTFTLFTAEFFDQGLTQIPRYNQHGCTVFKKLTDFYYNQGSRFYQDPNTKQLFCMPDAFHETFQKAFFRLQPQDTENSDQ